MNTSLTYPKTGDKYLQFLLTESSGFLKSGKQNIPDGIGVYLYPKNIFVTTILDQNLVLAASTSKTCRPSLLLKSQVPIPQSHCHVNTGSIHKSQPTPESINQNHDCHTFPGHILKTLVTNKLIREYLEMSKSAGTVNKVVKDVCREFI